MVINDGSKKEFDPVFDEIAKIENVTYLTYEENHGKGYALKMAFKYCVENFDKGDCEPSIVHERGGDSK